MIFPATSSHLLQPASSFYPCLTYFTLPNYSTCTSVILPQFHVSPAKFVFSLTLPQLLSLLVLICPTTHLTSASPRLTSPSLGMGLESRHISEVLCSGTRKLQSWDGGKSSARGGSTCTVMLGKKAGSPRLNTDTSNTGFFSLPITSLDLFSGDSLVCDTKWQVVL